MQLPRFFFNKNTKLCEDFIYFGSAGNRNNFLSLEECQRRCPGHCFDLKKDDNNASAVLIRILDPPTTVDLPFTKC